MSDQTKKPGRKKNLNLHSIPDGWRYQITVLGGAATGVVTADPKGPEVEVVWQDPEGTRRQVYPDLAAGLKALADGAKVLDRVAKAAAEVEQAKNDALGILGDTDTPADAKG